MKSFDQTKQNSYLICYLEGKMQKNKDTRDICDQSQWGHYKVVKLRKRKDLLIYATHIRWLYLDRKDFKNWHNGLFVTSVKVVSRI